MLTPYVWPTDAPKRGGILKKKNALNGYYFIYHMFFLSHISNRNNHNKFEKNIT